MARQTTPTFRDLAPDEIHHLLAAERVGRLAYSFRDRVDIEPFHYAVDEGWLYGRTAPGEKLTTIEHHRWVAVEVDEVEGVFEWRSVIVKGVFYILNPGGTEHEKARYQRAVAALRRIIPGTLTDHDPVPFRTVVFGIAIEDVTGRQATQRA